MVLGDSRQFRFRSCHEPAPHIPLARDCVRDTRKALAVVSLGAEGTGTAGRREPIDALLLAHERAADAPRY